MLTYLELKSLQAVTRDKKEYPTHKNILLHFVYSFQLLKQHHEITKCVTYHFHQRILYVVKMMNTELLIVPHLISYYH